MLGLSSRSPHARSLLDTAAELAAKLEVAWFVVHVRQPMALHYGREATEYPIPEADLACETAWRDRRHRTRGAGGRADSFRTHDEDRVFHYRPFAAVTLPAHLPASHDGTNTASRT